VYNAAEVDAAVGEDVCVWRGVCLQTAPRILCGALLLERGNVHDTAVITQISAMIARRQINSRVVITLAGQVSVCLPFVCANNTFHCWLESNNLQLNALEKTMAKSGDLHCHDHQIIELKWQCIGPDNVLHDPAGTVLVWVKGRRMT